MVTFYHLRDWYGKGKQEQKDPARRPLCEVEGRAKSPKEVQGKGGLMIRSEIRSSARINDADRRPPAGKDEKKAAQGRTRVKNKRRRKGQERSASMKSQQVLQTKREPSQESEKHQKGAK
jgi:hypothetical protein